MRRTSSAVASRRLGSLLMREMMARRHSILLLNTVVSSAARKHRRAVDKVVNSELVVATLPALRQPNIFTHAHIAVSTRQTLLGKASVGSEVR